MDKGLIFSAVVLWCGITYLILRWTSNHSIGRFYSSTEFPHVCHSISWTWMALSGAVLIYLGVNETEKLGPMLLIVWPLWCLNHGIKSWIAWRRNEPRET
jgi:hypothetical protein